MAIRRRKPRATTVDRSGKRWQWACVVAAGATAALTFGIELCSPSSPARSTPPALAAARAPRVPAREGDRLRLASVATPEWVPARPVTGAIAGEAGPAGPARRPVGRFAFLRASLDCAIRGEGLTRTAEGLREEFACLLAADPGAVEAALEAVQDATLDPEARALLWEALAASGVPAAEAGIANLAAAPGTEAQIRWEAVAALAGFERATSGTLATLADLAAEGDDFAVAALGALAKLAQGRVDPAVLNTLAARLLDQLGRRSELDRFVVRALAALPGPDALPALVRAAGDVRDGLRMEAVWGLGGRDDPEALKVLAYAVACDPSARVRAAAARAASASRSALVVPALAGALRGDPDPAVRRSARLALVELSKRMPEAAAALE